jgi:hypothetical protein
MAFGATHTSLSASIFGCFSRIRGFMDGTISPSTLLFCVFSLSYSSWRCLHRLDVMIDCGWVAYLPATENICLEVVGGSKGGICNRATL